MKKQEIVVQMMSESITVKNERNADQKTIERNVRSLRSSL